MRLFLASENLGNFAHQLVKMTNDKKVLVIANARDHYTPKRRCQMVKDTCQTFTNLGFNAEELDLRPYFRKPEALKTFINQASPSLIFCTGGNFYTLATALKLSGLQEILQFDLAKDKYVYAGYSAGAMVASRDLTYYLNTYGKKQHRIQQTKQTYGEIFMSGLGLINDVYICPHANVKEYHDIAKTTANLVRTSGETAILLNDSDVFIMQGDERLILQP